MRCHLAFERKTFGKLLEFFGNKIFAGIYLQKSGNDAKVDKKNVSMRLKKRVGERSGLL